MFVQLLYTFTARFRSKTFKVLSATGEDMSQRVLSGLLSRLMIISICFGLTPPPTAAQEQGAKNGTAPASMKLEAAGASMAEANNGSNPPIMLELEQKGKVKPQVASAQSSFSDGATTNGANALPSKVMLKGQVTYLVPKGTGLKLKLATVPTSGLRLMNRDDDGNLYPARQ